MLDWNDRDTPAALQELHKVARERGRRLAFWIGAGPSSWCGYPLWGELANRVHGDFLRLEPSYHKTAAARAVESRDYPALFDLCIQSSPTRLRGIMESEFRLRDPTPRYLRFVGALAEVRPTFVLTTNFEELLEKHLAGTRMVAGRDIERLSVMLLREESFVCKLHGTVGDLGSLVMGRRQYDALRQNEIFIEQLARTLSLCHVVFLGYAFGDQHVIDSLVNNEKLHRVLDEGPHFLVTTKDEVRLPPSVRRIRYTTEPHRDHRAVIHVLDEIRSATTPAAAPRVDVVPQPASPAPTAGKRSAHLLFDILPPGTWETSQTATAEREDGSEIEFVVGTGLTREELPPTPTAAHDLLVGLVCFDEVHAPLSAIGRLLRLLGGATFWRLIDEETLRFVWWDGQVGVSFPKGNVAGGDIGVFQILNPDKSERTVQQILEDAHFGGPENLERIHARTQTIRYTEEGDLTGAVRSLLIRPSIRQLLGISGGTPLHAFARWNTYPILRLANVVKVGIACRLLGFDSVKLDYGMAQLAGPALAAAANADWTTDAAAGFVLCGRFAADLGRAAEADPTMIDAVLRFRGTAEGEKLRAEIAQGLRTDTAGSIEAVVNGALTSAISRATLDRARNRFCELHVRAAGERAPALWNDSQCADWLRAWRRVNHKRLDEYCRTHKIGLYDRCPCGSGEGLKYCCAESLSR